MRLTRNKLRQFIDASLEWQKTCGASIQFQDTIHPFSAETHAKRSVKRKWQEQDEAEIESAKHGQQRTDPPFLKALSSSTCCILGVSSMLRPQSQIALHKCVQNRAAVSWL